MKRKYFLRVVLMVSLAIMAFSLPAWAAGTIKIGVIGPMNFVQGKGHWNGAVMAAEEINAKGAFRSARRR